MHTYKKFLLMFAPIVVAFICLVSVAPASADSLGQCNNYPGNYVSSTSKWQHVLANEGVTSQAVKQIFEKAGYNPLDQTEAQWMKARVQLATAAKPFHGMDYGCRDGDMFPAGVRYYATGKPVFVVMSNQYAKGSYSMHRTKKFSRRVSVVVTVIGFPECGNTFGLVRITIDIWVAPVYHKIATPVHHHKTVKKHHKTVKKHKKTKSSTCKSNTTHSSHTGTSVCSKTTGGTGGKTTSTGTGTGTGTPTGTTGTGTSGSTGGSGGASGGSGSGGTGGSGGASGVCSSTGGGGGAGGGSGSGSGNGGTGGTGGSGGPVNCTCVGTSSCSVTVTPPPTPTPAPVPTPSPTASMTLPTINMINADTTGTGTGSNCEPINTETSNGGTLTVNPQYASVAQCDSNGNILGTQSDSISIPLSQGDATYYVDFFEGNDASHPITDSAAVSITLNGATLASGTIGDGGTPNVWDIQYPTRAS